MAGLSFGSFLQGPLGEAIETVDTMAALPEPGFRPSVLLQRAGEPTPSPVRGPKLGLLGPGDVAGLAPGTVVRCEPTPGAVDVEPNYLACVEVRPPELPWVLTPARAAVSTSDGVVRERLRPWLVLVVVDAGSTPVTEGPPATITAQVAQLPDLSDSWGWAHVQRSAGEPVARLLCPRRLDSNVDYRACLVPAFASGRDAGLGKPPPADHQLAWDVARDQTVTLPVYHHWTFRTGPEGDFEQLVSRLGPADQEALRVSATRPVDIREPWVGNDPLDPGPQRLGVTGALVPFRDPPAAEPAATAAVQAELARLLRAQLDAPDDALAGSGPGGAEPGDETGALAPPLYGARHVLRNRVESDPAWIAQLNTSVAHRIAAGLGATYVRVHQEELMARAWEQVGEIREANRRRAMVELTTAVAERLHDKHVTSLGAGELLTFTAPASARTRTSGSTTLSLELGMSVITDGLASSAFARRVRPASKLARRSGVTVQSVVGRALAGEVDVPDPAPVLTAPPETGEFAVADVVNPAAASQMMVLTAMSAVAQVNGLAAGSMQDQLSQLGDRVMSLSAAGDVSTLAADIGDSVGEITAVTQGIFTTLTETPDAFGDLSSRGLALDAGVVADRVLTALQPGDSHWARLASMTVLPGEVSASGFGDPVLAYPEFPVPTALALLESDPEWLLPGLGALPTNKVALLRQNSAFIESFLVGINHEMMRELLWREYPTDRRGTPFSRFWPRPDGAADINPLHTWTDAAALGDRLLLDEDLAVVLVRGDVLRRYPDTVVTAVRSGAPDADGHHRPDPALPPLGPLFLVKVDAQTNAYAFKIPEPELSTPATPDAPGWFFVFAENGHRVRFGIDELDPGAAADLGSWNTVAWPHRDGSPGGSACVPVQRGHAIAGSRFGPPSGVTEPRWDRDSADVARITLQRPFRVAIQADLLLQPPEDPG